MALAIVPMYLGHGAGHSAMLAAFHGLCVSVYGAEIPHGSTICHRGCRIPGCPGCLSHTGSMPTRHSLAPRTEFIVPAEDVTSERVKAAFRAQALADHPDRVAAEGGGEEEQRAANVRFQRLQVRRVVCRV
jgi:hypothetical protein